MNKEKNNLDISSIESCGIYYFSGTGNTLFTAIEFENILRKNNSNIKEVDYIDFSKIDHIGSQRDYDLIIVAYPTYAWMPPKFVLDFIKTFPKVKNKALILISTAAYSFGYSLGISRKIFSNKNYNILATLKYIMPSNSNFLKNSNAPSKEKIEEKINKTQQKIKEDYKLLSNGHKIIHKANFFVKLISKFVNYGFNKFANKKSKWKADIDQCKFCRFCENICPVDNIKVKSKKKEIIFGDNCVFCTRCYNFCKNNAIYFKKIKSNKKSLEKYNYFKDLITKRNK